MNFSIKGTQANKSLLEAAARFFATQLNLDWCPDTITIKQTAKMRRSHGQQNGRLITLSQYQGHSTFGAASDVHQNWERELISTLAHEMVHMQQYMQGRLYMHYNSNYQHEPMQIYNGVPYSRSMSYMTRPWEQEAFGREKGLMAAFYAHETTTGVKAARQEVMLPALRGQTKSSMIRAALRSGQSVKEVANSLDAHYSFVYGIAKRIGLK